MKRQFLNRAHWKPVAVMSGIAALLAASSVGHAESDLDYCNRQEGVAKTVCLRDLKTTPAAPAAPATPAATAAPAAAAGGSESDRAYCERQEGIAKTVCLRDLKSAPAAAAAAPAATAAASGAAPAKPAATAAAGAAAPAAGGALYKVVDGYHVDPDTLKGFQTWRAAACDRCHGPNQEGLVGPSLVNSLKVLTKADFVTTVTNGRLEKGMPSFATNTQVISNIDHLYAYLKGRSDGAITKSHVEAMQ